MREVSRSVRRLGCLALAGALAAACPVVASPEARPNILFIHADDLGWRDLSCYGAEHYRTPAIDSLAREGMRFTQAYAGAPVCTPSRAALVTGLHCARLHVTGQSGYKTEDTSDRMFAHPDFKTVFPANTPSVARTLKQAGYRTVILGKWGFDDDPRAHGFDSVVAGKDDDLVDAAGEWMARDEGKPFFVYLNFSRPHVPLHPDPARTAAYAADPAFQNSGLNPAYAAEIEAVDNATAALVRKLDSLALAPNTVVIFASDNGGFLGRENERVATNAPLRDGKASLYEGGIRVPAIVRWPGVAKPGSTSDGPVHWIDWHATLAAIAGAAAPTGLDGISFAPALRGQTTHSPRPLFWHYPHYRRALPGISASPSSAVRTGDWKLIHFYETDNVELYNLRDDPGEAHDLSLHIPKKATELRTMLDGWRNSINAQRPVSNRGA